MCEIAGSADKPFAQEPELERATLDWLVDAGFVGGLSDILEIRWVDAPHGYPVQTAGRMEICAEIAAYLEPLGIHTVGRFGRWEYVNSDACIRDGLELGRRLSAARP